MSQIHRFYLSDLRGDQTDVYLTGENAKIVKRVLRLQTQDSIELLNGRGLRSKAEIQSFSGDVVKCTITQAIEEKLSMPEVHLSMGLLKSDKNLMVLQKLTEVGASSISFFNSDFSIAKSKSEKKEKFEKVCIEALRQSGNPYLPFIQIFSNLKEVLAYYKKMDTKIILQERETNPWWDNRETAPSYHIMVGPEGGFSKAELDRMLDAGYVKKGLSRFVLRSETAAMVACASLLLMNEKNE